MALTIIQSGTALQTIDADGALTTLTLPTGITLRSDVPPRWAVFDRFVVLVNTPSRPITIDATGTVRPLTPLPPRNAPILTGPASGGLTGTYRARATFRILDSDGVVIAESDYGPVSAAVSVTSKTLQAANLDLSPETISARALYRTATNGTNYFEWVHVDGNVLTSVRDDLADAGLSLVDGPILGTPPRLTTIAEFRGRLFGTGDVAIDDLRYTEADVMYAWPEDNVIPIAGGGSDLFGVVALMPRRDALGVGRRNMLIQITGDGSEDQNGVNLGQVVLSRELGVESQETVKIYRDTAFFLWKDGVYAWGTDGLRCVSDGDGTGRGAVRSWFVTDDYFNRDQFPYAFAEIDPTRPCYRLFLCEAGSTAVTHWVEFNFKDGTWWGPHKTALFTPLSAFQRTNTANRLLPIIGAATAVYDQQDTRTDGSSTAITFDTIGKRHDAGDPDRDKYFGQISVHGAAQASGTLSVVSRTGSLSATTTLTQSFTLTNTRQRLGRLGVGKHAQIELTQATAGVDVELYGYEIDPVNVLGRR